MSAKPSHQHQKQPAHHQRRHADFTPFHLEPQSHSGLGSYSEGKRREKEKKQSAAARARQYEQQQSQHAQQKSGWAAYFRWSWNMKTPNNSRAKSKSNDNGSLAGNTVLILFGLIWTVFMGFADWMVLGSMARQGMSYFYVPVPAIVLKTSVESRSTDEGNKYTPRIDYSYRFNNIGYTSSRVRYSAMSNDATKRAAKEFVDARPEGTQITAWVDSYNPGNAVLETGVRGEDLFVALFLTPFNVVALGILWMFWQMWRGGNDPLGGIALEEGPNGFRAEVGRKAIFLTFIATLGIVSFLSIFAVLIVGGRGFNPSLTVMLWTWAAVLGLTLASVLAAIRGNYSGLYDLEVDWLHNTVIVPASSQNSARRTYALQDPSAVVLREVVRTDSDGDSTSTYRLEFRLHEADQTVVISELHMGDAASAFAGWLAKKLDLPLKRLKGSE